MINDLKNRLLRTVEIRSPHNFACVLHISVGDPVFLSSTSPNDITAGTTGLVARVQRIIQSELGSAMVVDVEERPVYAAQ